MAQLVRIRGKRYLVRGGSAFFVRPRCTYEKISCHLFWNIDVAFARGLGCRDFVGGCFTVVRRDSSGAHRTDWLYGSIVWRQFRLWLWMVVQTIFPRPEAFRFGIAGTKKIWKQEASGLVSHL